MVVTYGEMPIPTRTGYQFVGWFTTLDGNFDAQYYSQYSDIASLSDSDLYRHWIQRGLKEGRLCSASCVNAGSIYGYNYDRTENITLYAIWCENVAIIDEVCYSSMQSALNNSYDGCSISLSKNITEDTIYDSSNTITIYNNGNNWSGSTPLFINKGSINLFANGNITASDWGIVMYGGTLNLNDGEVYGIRSGIIVCGEVSIIINDGIVKGDYDGIFINYTGKTDITINDGLISGHASGIETVSNNGKIQINGGNIEATTYYNGISIVGGNSNDIIIEDGNIYGVNWGIYSSGIENKIYWIGGSITGTNAGNIYVSSQDIVYYPE